MNETTIFSYLSGLAANNNREWYHAYKTGYQKANGQFEALLQDLIFKIGKTDGSILHKMLICGKVTQEFD